MTEEWKMLRVRKSTHSIWKTISKTLNLPIYKVLADVGEALAESLVETALNDKKDE